jgi:hypothetical protein
LTYFESGFGLLTPEPVEKGLWVFFGERYGKAK